MRTHDHGNDERKECGQRQPRADEHGAAPFAPTGATRSGDQTDRDKRQTAEFKGAVAEKEIPDTYVDSSVGKGRHWRRRAQSPREAC